MTKPKTKKSPKGTKTKPKAKARLKKATTKRVAKKAVPKKVVKKPRANRATKKTGRGMHPNSQANLMRTAGPGRPKGKLDFNTRVDMAIETLALQLVEHHNKQKKNKGDQITIEHIDIEGDIFMQLLNKARSGNEKMLDSYLDRRHGKATARLELTGANGNPIEIEERKAEVKSKARKMLDSWTKKK